MVHRVVMLHTHNPARTPIPGELGELIEVRFEKMYEGEPTQRVLDVKWDSGLVESLVEGQDVWTVFEEDEQVQTFGSVAFGDPIPDRIKGLVREYDLNGITQAVRDLPTRETFTNSDPDLNIVLALLWQYYVLLYKGRGPHNPELVAEFYRRMDAGSFSSQDSKPKVIDLHEITIEEIIQRAKRAAHNLQKYNLPEEFDVGYEEHQENLMWVDGYDLSPDEAAELMFVAISELEDVSNDRVQINNPKRILINCLELVKIRGKAMYYFACFSSQEEYDTIDEDDAEIFGCLANNEQEANEILSRKNYWLFYLIDVRALD